MPRFSFESDFPIEVADAIIPILKKWEWLVPSWCHEIIVHYVGSNIEDDERQNVMAMQTMTEYRNADLHIYPDWLSKGKRDRERDTVHELCHLLVAPLTEYYYESLHRQVKDKEVRDLLEEHHRRAMESVVTDLQNAFTEARKPARSRKTG